MSAPSPAPACPRSLPSPLSIGFVLALGTATARAQTVPPVEPTGVVETPPQPPYIVRPLLLPPGALEVRFGMGLAASQIATGGFGNGRTGLGLHTEAVLGLLRRVEIDGGLGLRVPNDGALLAADRYARVDRDEVYETGNGTLGNPYVRLRVALLDRDDVPVHVAAEGMMVAPVAAATSWAFGLGVPVHLVLSRRVRIETGLFVLVLPSDTSLLRNVVTLPVRFDVAVSTRVVLGLVTGIYGGNVLRDDAYSPRVPLGIEALFRIEPRTDLVVQWQYPTLVPQGINAAGFGIGVAERLL